MPNFCEFTFDFRSLPLVDTKLVLKEIEDFIHGLNQKMQAQDSTTGIYLSQDCNVPAMSDSESQALQQLIENLVDDKRRHKVAYATEGGQFTNAGIPTVICGPGDIEQAHKPNEFVSLEQLAKCDKFLQQILQNCL